MSEGGVETNPWPRVGPCGVCRRENQVLHESRGGVWACSEEHACFDAWSVLPEREAERRQAAYRRRDYRNL